MNPTEQRIFNIIKADVCGMCLERALAGHSETCRDHQPRCYAGYERQARAIYKQIVKPLIEREDDLK